MKKNKVYWYLIGVLMVVFISSCDNKTVPAAKDIVLSKVDYSGCFNTEEDISTYVSPKEADSVFYTIKDDTLSLNIFKNYNCCGNLKDSVAIENQDVNIFISDKNKPEGFCDCHCTFKFKLKFTEFPDKHIKFNIYLKKLGDEDYTLWKQTKLDYLK